MWMMKRYDKTDRNAHIALGAVLGAATGVTAGLLFAPHSGSVTRDRLRGKARDAKDRAGEHVTATKQKAAGKLNQALEKSKTVADQTADKAKDVADRTSNRAKSAADRAKRDAGEE